MEHCRAAERALVTALVLGEVDPADLSGRLRAGDFTDSAARMLFEVVVSARLPSGSLSRDLPVLLQRQGMLRLDGYPISHLLEWLPRLPVPVHTCAWAALVVAGSLSRQVRASGVRLLQSVESARDGRYGPGQVLAVAVAQRAALAGAARRWDGLPGSWRDTVPSRLLAVVAPATPAVDVPDDVASAEAEAGGVGRERELLVGLVAAPHLLGRIPWLRCEDFTDPACGSLFGTLRQLHEGGRHVDVVTLAAAAEPGSATGAGETPAGLASTLRADQAFPHAVPFLARQVLEHAVLVEAQQAGEGLLRLAAAPAAVGGLGTPMLTSAAALLDSLRPHALRLDNATRQSRPRIGSGSDRAQVHPVDRADGTPRGALDRHAG